MGDLRELMQKAEAAEEAMTHSTCQICGREFPHPTDSLCLKVSVCLDAEIELRRCIREDSKIAENMRDYWKNQGVND